jgi:hypothetical protein
MSLVSTLWAAKYNSGDLLGDRDLLSGDKIRPLAEQISAEWTSLSKCVTKFCEILADRQIKYREHYSSLNALVVLLTWIWIGFSWGEGRTLSAIERDDFDKQLINTFCRFCDGVFNSLKTAFKIEEVGNALVAWMGNACDQLVSYAESNLDALEAPIREQVSLYRVTLWLWDRLEEARWQDSQIALRTKKAKDMSVDVDHVLSVKAWDEMRKKHGTSDEPDLLDPINQLGNCILLEKDFNISKGKKSMRAFLSEVHEFKNDATRISTWAKNLRLEEQHIDPASGNVEELTHCINRRTKAIKDDVREWIYGFVERKDLP